MREQQSHRSSSWHGSPRDIESYVRGLASPAASASIEAHIVGCASCQAEAARVVPSVAPEMSDRLSLVFGDLIDSVDAGRPGLMERLGVPEHVARILVTTPRIERPWLLAVISTLAFTVLAAPAGDVGLGLFLAVAPILPMAMVAASFVAAGPSSDELEVTMPVSTLWLLILRSISVLVPTLVLCGIAAVALPSHGWEAAGWVLPSLALCSAAALLSTWIRPVTASGLLVVAWLGVLTALSGRLAGTSVPVRSVADSPIFGPTGQGLALVVTAVGALLVYVRRDALDTRSLV